MARRVLLDFDTELHVRLAKRSDFDSTLRAQLLHDGYLWVCATYVHRELEGTTIGSQAIGSDEIILEADDLAWIELLKNTDTGKNVYLGDKDEIENREKQSGDPMRFYWWAGQVITDRKPTVIRAYKAWYQKVVDEIDTSPITDRLFDPIIIMKAAEMGYSTIRDFKEAIGVAGEIERYTNQFNLPKLRQKLNTQRAGFQPRLR
jgi:hypothetical protein